MTSNTLTSIGGCHSTGLRSDVAFLARPKCIIHLLCAFYLLVLSSFSGCSRAPNQSHFDKESSGAKSITTEFDLNSAFQAIVDLEKKAPDVLPVFVDVASEKNLQFEYYNDEQGQLNLPETFGGGAACFDFDLDGYCDVWFPNGSELLNPDESKDSLSSQTWNDFLFRNVGGRFVDCSKEASFLSSQYSHGCSFGDVNLDGFEDIAIANYGSCQIFLNQGDGTFLEQISPSIAAAESWWSVVAIADLDQDRCPDLVCIPYVAWKPGAPLGSHANGPVYAGPNEFPPLEMSAFKNLGDGSWGDRSMEWGLNAMCKGLAVSIVDLDHDLAPEVFVANDSEANQLFTTSRDLKFNAKLTNGSRAKISNSSNRSASEQALYKDVAELSGTAACISGEDAASMSATIADFDANGWEDLLVTNYMGRSNSLYANRGGLNFRDITNACRMDSAGRDYLSFGACPVDFDLDGDWDVVIANGHVLGPNVDHYKQNAQFLQNIDGTFLDITSNAGAYFKLKTLGRSVATMDYDNDGDTDLIVTHVDRPASLLENRTATKRNNWLSIQLYRPDHSPLAGTRIEINFDNQKQLCIPVQIAGSYLSDSQRQWTIGVPQDIEIDAENPTVQLKIFWPDKSVDQWTAIELGTRQLISPNRIQRLSTVSKANVNGGADE